MVVSVGKMVGVNLRLHGLRRHGGSFCFRTAMSGPCAGLQWESNFQKRHHGLEAVGEEAWRSTSKHW